ncbi:MAG: bifunctional [glutamate--ammonia ligase]-adenylyl-L-tyrosine phosphorylase/[glutamate--ammonia-ligase] adenylyltransferase [Betaproteobacteria bacterium]|nr:bifunctional [glutamate--ammonia ligase]-adenylyl-L-tyrosine phosphorylase/[glutamate--ammonia-ligase] adenylyltransferase [Betaproteobacteria bacterium]
MSAAASISKDLPSAIARAARLSRYVRDLLSAEPGLATGVTLDAPLDRGWMHAQIEGRDHDDQTLKTELRRLRKAVMLGLITRDLDGRANLAEVVDTVTALAEEAVAAATASHAQWLAREFGNPLGAISGDKQQLHIIAMGKLGGGELNVSSDIDIVFAYPEDGETDGPRRISNHEYFIRLARRIISAIAEVTMDGFVFRVDTRLRPYGDSGPLAVSFDMLEEYFTTQGREWERYAWVKARPVTGEAGADLDAVVTPFVYRRHLDYSAIASLRSLHAQIRQEVQKREIADNIKLGRGGIREIEFLVQVFQIIRGGREPVFRLRPTLKALALLGERRLLPGAAVDELRTAYVYLRNLEHRLQYLDDQQTQMLPRADEDRALVAEMMGCADYAGLRRELDAHRAVVSRHFEAIFAGVRENGGVQDQADLWLQALSREDALARLAGMGFSDVGRIYARLMAIRGSARYRRMAASSQALLDRLIPQLMETAHVLPNPDTTFERMFNVVDSIGRREAYLALLLEYPNATARLARLASASPWAADYLAQHPVLLDELIDPQGSSDVADWPRLRETLHASLDEHDGNTERQMDILRHFKQTQTLRLLALDLAGALSLETLSDHLSDLACTVLEEVLRLAWNALRVRHREQPQFAIVGYGKLGGKELGYASDLDIIFLYDDEDQAAPETYARLAQRINTWLTSATSAGVLYEIDLRLRPNGAAGLLVSQIDAFREYEFEKAWVWEHQALTRARFVAGADAIGRRFERLRIEVLCRPRDLAALGSEILSMRDKMRDAHPNGSGLFDLKHDRGGIVDVEFVVQFLVLGHAHRHAGLTGNIGNLALLKLAAGLGLLPDDLASGAHAAYREFRRLQHAMRLQGERYARVDPAGVAEHVQAVLHLWEWVFGNIRRVPAQPE